MLLLPRPFPPPPQSIEGCTPPENLLGCVPKGARRADILLLGCSDARHVLYTLWTYASECATAAGPEGGLGSLPRPDRLRVLRFTLNDREPACMARVLLLLQLFLDSRDALVSGESAGHFAAQSLGTDEEVTCKNLRLPVMFVEEYYIPHIVFRNETRVNSALNHVY